LNALKVLSDNNTRGPDPQTKLPFAPRTKGNQESTLLPNNTSLVVGAEDGVAHVDAQAAENPNNNVWKDLLKLLKTEEGFDFFDHFKIVPLSNKWHELQNRAITACCRLVGNCPKLEQLEEVTKNSIASIFYAVVSATVTGLSFKDDTQTIESAGDNDGQNEQDPTEATEHPTKEMAKERILSTDILRDLFDTFVEEFLLASERRIGNPLALEEYIKEKLERAQQLAKRVAAGGFCEKETAYSEFIYAAQQLQNEVEDLPEPERAHQLSGIISRCLANKRDVPSLNPKPPRKRQKLEILKKLRDEAHNEKREETAAWLEAKIASLEPVDTSAMEN